MTKKSDEVKRQLFKGFHTAGSALDNSTSNLLSRTLRKESDKYRRAGETALDEQQFVIHKSTSPEYYQIFSSRHPLRESRLQAMSQAETALDELFRRNGADDSGSEDDDPDLSSIAPPNHIHQDDILISVPGYSREEITASKRLSINDRKNVRLSKVSSLERAFTNTDFLKDYPHSKIQEYRALNNEFNERVDILKEELKLRKQQEQQIIDAGSPDRESEIRYHEARLEILREAVANLDSDNWMYQTAEYQKSP
ncbi:hypothetical protein BON22_2022 [Cyberlindnera fabianii]|uniref:Uncharacterized protein n=1 Tax=Cyberlindnera fabianii TaxID=36022 RepID=A0A1V2L7R3_CYBFA|nr:hypothetical protein BON22_2022 [Cyberlindnera fabianii]